MDLNLIAIVVLILLAIVLAISIFNDSKKNNFSLRKFSSSKSSESSNLFKKFFRRKNKR